MKRSINQQIVAAAVWVTACVLWMPDASAQSAAADIVVKTKRSPESRSNPAVVRYGLTRDDFEHIKSIPTIQTAVPIRVVAQQARFGERKVDANIVGTSDAFDQVDGVEVDRGRFLSKRDITQLNNVAVLQSDAASDLFGDEDPIGKNVRIQDDYFLVVGVTKSRTRWEHAIYIPISTMRSRLGDMVLKRDQGALQMEAYELSEIRIIIDKRENIASTAQIITRLLDSSHDAQDYSISAAGR